MALEIAFHQLDHDWLILVDLRINGRSDATAADYVALHPHCGIALIDVILSRTGDPAQRLREFLESEGFSAQFPGTLPIVRLVLHPTNIASFRQRLDAAFAAVPPITIAEPNWAVAINDLLVPTAPSIPQPIVPLFKRATGRSESAPPQSVPRPKHSPPDELWDVAPERWPDQLAEATPLKRSHRAARVERSPLAELPNFASAGGATAHRRSGQRQASARPDRARHAAEVPLETRYGETQAEASPDRRRDIAPALRPAAVPSPRDPAPPPENAPPENAPPVFAEAISPPNDQPEQEAIASPIRPRRRAAVEAERRPLFSAVIAPMIQRMVRRPSQLTSQLEAPTASFGMPPENADDDSPAGSPVRRDDALASPAVVADSRPRARAAAAIVLGILSAGTVWLIVRDLPGKRISASTSASTTSTAPAPDVAFEAQPMAPPEPSVASFSVPAPVLSSPTPIPPTPPIPQPKVKPTELAPNAGIVAAPSLAVPLAKPIAGAVKVGIETGIHDGFGRIVFAWPEAVKYETHLDEKSLTIRFSRPLTADLARIAKQLPRYAEGTTMEGGSTVVVALKRALGLETFLKRNRVVIDLLDQPAAAAAGRSPPMPPSVPVKVVDENGLRRLLFEWPEPVEFTASVVKGEATIRFKRAATIDLDQLAAAAPDLAARSSGGGNEVTLLLKLPTGSKLTAHHLGNLVAVDVAPAKYPKPVAGKR